MPTPARARRVSGLGANGDDGLDGGKVETKMVSARVLPFARRATLAAERRAAGACAMTAPRPDALLRTKPTPKPVIRCLATVEPETVNFLWPSRIAFGKLSLIVGDPGLGKSTVMLDVAARMSRGAEWTDGGSTPRAPIVLLSAEDGLGDTIRPRLDALGADVNMVHALTAVQLPTGNERCVSLATDIEAVETTIEQTGARLVVIDPLSAYMGR